MPGDWRLYEPEVLDYWFKCKECGGEMQNVHDVSFIKANISNENEVYYCENCQKYFERVPLARMVGMSIRYTWKLIKFVHGSGL